jgi:hypothetical protein
MERVLSDPGHAALFERLKDASQYVPLPGFTDDDGFAILDDVYVGQTAEAVSFISSNPEWGSFRLAVPRRGLIDTGAQGCTITPALADYLDLKPVPGTEIVRVRQQMVDGSSGGYVTACPTGITLGGVYYRKVDAPPILVPVRDAEDNNRYEILIGCEILKDCTLIYDGLFEGEFTLYVPRNIPPG